MAMLSDVPEFGPLHASTTKIADFSEAVLLRGDIHPRGFNDLLAQIRLVQDMFRQFNGTNPAYIPSAEARELQHAADECLSVMTQMARYNPDQDDGSKRAEILMKFDAGLASAFRSVQRVSMTVRNLELGSTLQVLDAKAQDMSKQLTVSKEITAKLEDRLAEKAVADEANRFQTQRDRHETAARNWLFATSVLGVALLILTVTLFVTSVETAREALQANHEVPVGASIQVTIGRLVLVSLVATGALAAWRVYKAHRHNAVVNDHRANALACFRDFAAATREDPDVKRAVLLQATQCIFSPQHTGFIPNEPDTVLASSLIDLAAKGGASAK